MSVRDRWKSLERRCFSLVLCSGMVGLGKVACQVLHAAGMEVEIVKSCQHRSTLEFKLAKKCTPLWREEHLQVKLVKELMGLSAVQRISAVARTAFGSRNCEELRASRRS